MSIRTLALIPLLAVTAPLHAQERVRVEAKVSSLLGNTVFIDAGQAAGLRAEDAVFFELSNGTRAEGRVRAVAKNSARVEMLPGAPLPSVGERAWSEVPRERLRCHRALEVGGRAHQHCVRARLGRSPRLAHRLAGALGADPRDQAVVYFPIASGQGRLPRQCRRRQPPATPRSPPVSTTPGQRA